MYEIALKLLKEIKKLGYTAYIVGGYPRDKYMEITSEDIDICTNMTPTVMKQNFIITASFEKYGSMRILYDGYSFEITTFRKDGIYKDKRRPETVEFVQTLEEDLERRDFVINTLCIDENGCYVDLLGARKDIDKKIIRVVGDTKKKLSEDPLRIVRALRFSIDLDFHLTEDIQTFIKNNNLLKEVSESKKQEEIKKCKNSVKLNDILKELTK